MCAFLHINIIAGDFACGGSDKILAFFYERIIFSSQIINCHTKRTFRDDRHGENTHFAVIATFFCFLNDYLHLLLASSYCFRSIFPCFSAMEWKWWDRRSAHSFIWTEYCKRINELQREINWSPSFYILKVIKTKKTNLLA